MNRKLRQIGFAGTGALYCLGASAVIALAYYLIYGIGSFNVSEMGAGDVLALFVCFWLGVGLIVLIVAGANGMNLYYPVLLSMSVTRKRAMAFVLSLVALTAAGLWLVALLIWRLIPGDVSAAGLSLAPGLAGGLLLVASLGILFGTVYLRWRRWGALAMSILLVLAIIVVCWYVIGNGVEELLDMLEKRNLSSFLAAGILGYLISGALAYWLTMDMEVRL